MELYVGPTAVSALPQGPVAVESSLRMPCACNSGQDPPPPTDNEVWLDAAGGELLAVLRLPGSATQQACGAARRRLVDALTKGRLCARCFSQVSGG